MGNNGENTLKSTPTFGKRGIWCHYWDAILFFNFTFITIFKPASYKVDYMQAFNNRIIESKFIWDCYFIKRHLLEPRRRV